MRRHELHPFASSWPPPPRHAGPEVEDLPDERRRRHEQHDQRLDDRGDVDGDLRLGLHRHASGIERAVEEGGQHHAARLGPPEQGDGDGVDAVGPVDLRGEGEVRPQARRSPRQVRRGRRR